MSEVSLQLLADAVTGSLSSASIDPELRSALLEAAEHHGVLGTFRLDAPHAHTALLRARARHLRALAFTLRVARAVEGAGIPVVVMKGAAAGSRWPDPTVRQQSDVDILVHPSQKDDAAQALISARVCSKRFLVSEAMHNDSLMPADSGGLVVEVHHYFNNHHDSHVHVGELLSRRVRVQTAQGELPALAQEDDAVYLAMHATTHALARFAWLVDLAGLTPDWHEAARRARAWNLSLAVEPAWRRARELLSVPIPEAAMRELRVPRAQRALAHLLLRGADASQGRLQRTLQQGFRLAVVPARSFPGVMVQKLKARREEAASYAVAQRK